LSCVLRWVLDGVPGPDGRRVRLEALRLGGRWVTSAEALQRFGERLTPAGPADAAPAPRPRRARAAPAPRSPAARTRDAAGADRDLDKLGI
jgi:hypothetical protein